MMKRRVVITGVGAITPLGVSLHATAAALARGDTGIRRATVFDASGFSCTVAAEVSDWDPRPHFRTPKALKIADRPARFAVAAARMALAAAEWPDDSARLDALGVAIGSSGSDLQSRDVGRALAGETDPSAVDRIDVFADRILRGLNPLWLLVSLPNMTSAQVAIQTQARGPNTTIMSDWVAGHQALGEAAEWIGAGETDAVLAGGADSGVQPFAYAAYEQAGWLAVREGEGFVPGEGAAIFLLEEHEAARARGRRPVAEIRGYAAAPASGGLARALCDALSRSGWQRDDVSACDVAAPPIGRFMDEAREAVDAVVAGRAGRLIADPRLGFALSAAAPIEAALRLHEGRPGRVLSAAVGSGGEAVALALDIPEPDEP